MAKESHLKIQLITTINIGTCILLPKKPAINDIINEGISDYLM